MKKSIYRWLGIPVYIICAAPAIVASILSGAKGFQIFLWVIGWTGGCSYVAISHWLRSKVGDE